MSGMAAGSTVAMASEGEPTGQQFYVATNGNDANSGTEPAEAWRTIQKAMNSATPGSTVNIMAGTYRERLTLNVSGSEGNHITFQPNGFSVPVGGCGGYTGVACGGDQVILDYAHLGTVTDGVPFLLISRRSHIRVQGLTFQNLTCAGPMQQGVRIDSGSSFIEFRHNKFLNNQNTHHAFDGTNALLHFRIWSPAHHITVYGNEIGHIKSQMSEALTASGTNATGIIFERNWIHDTDGIGIDLHGGANHYAVRHNKLEHIGKLRDGTWSYGMQHVAVYNDGGHTGIVEGNLVSDGGIAYQALSEPGQPATHNVTFRNNVAERCHVGILVGTWYSSTDGSSVSYINVFNNTFYGNHVGVHIQPMTSTTVNWKNNIFANNGTSYFNPLNWDHGTADYNLYFGGGVGPGSVLTADPLFNNADQGDYGLRNASPAIDAGDPASSAELVGSADFQNGPRIVGERIDLGAYEVQGGGMELTPIAGH